MTNKDKIKEEFVEKGADLEHSRWAKWQEYMHSKMEEKKSLVNWETQEVRDYVLPSEFFDRWERQIKTPYSELSEQEKESDRKEARSYLPLLDQVLSQQREDIVEMIKGMAKWELVNMPNRQKMKKFNCDVKNYNKALQEILTNLTKEQ